MRVNLTNKRVTRPLATSIEPLLPTKGTGTPRRPVLSGLPLQKNRGGAATAVIVPARQLTQSLAVRAAASAYLSRTSHTSVTDNPIIAAMAENLNLTSQVIDNLFIAAASK